MSLSDEASAEIASKLCGQVRKLKATYAINETSRQSGINFLSAQAGGGRGSVGASKSFTDHREAVFQPRDFALLGNCQAICLPYDGVQSPGSRPPLPPATGRCCASGAPSRRRRCQQTERGGCQQTPFHFPPSPFGFVVLDRTTRTAPAERERTGGSPARVRAGRRGAPSDAMLDALIRAVLVIGGVSAACAWTWPGAFPEADPVAVLVRYHTPTFYRAVIAWYYIAPGVAAFLAGQFLISTSRIWFARMGVSLGLRSRLPTWPLSPTADGPAIVIGEVHHPVKLAESPTPEWLTIPERGLYTGVAIFGAVGSGKTSACMHPFARQLLSWQAKNPERRPAALVLEVKGDFCHDIRRMLTELGRADDYIELSLDGRLTWNPLSATWLDSYSLAYTVASLLNQLFGKGKEPFWQQAYTNLVRWIIELYRVLPGGWVTLRDVYHCAIDKALFAKKIEQAQTWAADMGDEWITVPLTHFLDHNRELRAIGFTQHPADQERMRGPATPAAITYLTDHKIAHDRERSESTTATETRLRVEAVNRWYVHDWNTLDNKIRSSIVEGVSVFLSMFDLPDVARVFCPPAPGVAGLPGAAGYDPTDPTDSDTTILAATEMTGDLPPIDALIESGKVLALNMPAGTNPALSRAIGVMLKNAWLQSLLRRPATMKREPGRYVRPAVFICDEYQAFASVGEDDPSGDEKAFALTRQCRVIPIVATQSISSLRSVLGSSEAWRTLLQTLRTRIFLSLSDEASAEIASKLCGQVAKIKSSYTINESAKSSGINLLSAKAGGGRGSVGASKSFQERREALFQPRDFALLGNCQAICLPYDGVQSLPPRRVYLKPHYLPADLPYWTAKQTGQL